MNMTNHHHQNAIHPAVTRTIAGVLVFRGYRGERLHDAIAEVRVRLIEAVQRRGAPDTIEEWQAFASKIACDWACDEHRKRETAEQYDTGLCDTPDDYAPLVRADMQRDPVDAKRQLAVLLEMFDKGEMPEKGREILLGVADGVKLPKIGKELELPADEV